MTQAVPKIGLLTLHSYLLPTRSTRNRLGNACVGSNPAGREQSSTSLFFFVCTRLCGSLLPLPSCVSLSVLKMASKLASLLRIASRIRHLPFGFGHTSPFLRASPNSLSSVDVHGTLVGSRSRLSQWLILVDWKTSSALTEHTGVELSLDLRGFAEILSGNTLCTLHRYFCTTKSTLLEHEPDVTPSSCLSHQPKDCLAVFTVHTTAY